MFHPLFIAALAGNQNLYQELLTRIAELSRHFVHKKIGAQEEVEDIVQEILLSVHKALHTYDPERPCMPWLASIMHFRLTDWMRSHYKTQETQSGVALDEVEHFLVDHVTNEPLAYEYIHKAVKSLSTKQQYVIEALYFKEMTVAEASESLSMSISAVKVNAHRAYKQLAILLGETP